MFQNTTVTSKNIPIHVSQFFFIPFSIKKKGRKWFQNNATKYFFDVRSGGKNHQ